MLILVYAEIKDQDQIRLTWGLTQPNLIGVNDTVITLQPHTSKGFFWRQRRLTQQNEPLFPLHATKA